MNARMVKAAQRVYAAADEIDAVASGQRHPVSELIHARAAGMREAVSMLLDQPQQKGTD